ncbi:MAG: DUF169 domain-containing protein [Methanosarcinaceae archaeon]
MDYKEMSNKLVNLLRLNGKPIAVSLLKRSGDIPDNMEEIKDPLRYCQMLQKARYDGVVSFATSVNHSCKGGAAAIGLEDYPENIKTGALYFEKLGKEVSLSVAKRVVDNMPRPAPGSTVATIVAPLDNTPTKPDVVIVIGSTLAARRIAQAVIYKRGGRMHSNFAGIQSTCADATGSPYTTGEVNISIGCDGAAKNAGLNEDEMVVGIPEEMLEDIVTILAERAPGWDDWMRS